MRSRAKSGAFFSRRRWQHLRENCRIKIASENRNCGDAKFFLIFCRNKQRTNAKSKRSNDRGMAICRRRKNYAMIGVEVRPYGKNRSYFEDRFVRTDFGDRAAIVV